MTEEPPIVPDHDSRRERLAGGKRAAGSGSGTIRYSALVRRFKIIMPLAATVIILATVLWSGYNQPEIVKQRTPENTPPQTGKNELINPRFENKDDQGQPYVLSADKAVQDLQDQTLVRLTKPAGQLSLKQGHIVTIRSEEGELAQTDRKLLLRGHVVLTHDKGYEMTMDELHVDMKNSTAHSDSDIAGKGPAGTLEAKGLDGDQKQGLLTFHGPAKLVLYPKSSREQPLIPLVAP